MVLAPKRFLGRDNGAKWQGKRKRESEEKITVLWFYEGSWFAMLSSDCSMRACRIFSL